VRGQGDPPDPRRRVAAPGRERAQDRLGYRARDLDGVGRGKGEDEDNASGHRADLQADRDLPLGIEKVDDLFGGRREHIRVASGQHRPFGGPLHGRTRDIREAIDQPAQGLGEAVLRRWRPCLNAQVGGVRHDPVTPTGHDISFRIARLLSP
jgi:hypothetical protein